MTDEQFATANIRDFLADCPEHIQGVKVLKGETVLDTPSLKAFVQWSIRMGRGDRNKCKRFLVWLENRQ